MSSLMRRLMVEKLSKKKEGAPCDQGRESRPAVPPSLPFRFPEAASEAERAAVVERAVAPGAPRGSCKAINAETGRQCCLLAGHTKPHRHGSTDFTRVAAPGQQHFSRRDALDVFAASRSNPNTNQES